MNSRSESEVHKWHVGSKGIRQASSNVDAIYSKALLSVPSTNLGTLSSKMIHPQFRTEGFRQTEHVRSFELSDNILTILLYCSGVSYPEIVLQAVDL